MSTVALSAEVTGWVLAQWPAGFPPQSQGRVPPGALAPTRRDACRGSDLKAADRRCVYRSGAELRPPPWALLTRADDSHGLGMQAVGSSSASPLSQPIVHRGPNRSVAITQPPFLAP